MNCRLLSFLLLFYSHNYNRKLALLQLGENEASHGSAWEPEGMKQAGVRVQGWWHWGLGYVHITISMALPTWYEHLIKVIGSNMLTFHEVEQLAFYLDLSQDWCYSKWETSYPICTEGTFPDYLLKLLFPRHWVNLINFTTTIPSLINSSHMWIH